MLGKQKMLAMALLLMVVFLSGSLAYASKIYLTDGNQITGQILEDKFHFKTAILGMLELKVKDLDEYRHQWPGSSPHLYLKDESKLYAVITEKEITVTARMGEKRAQFTVSLSQIKGIKFESIPSPPEEVKPPEEIEEPQVSGAESFVYISSNKHSQGLSVFAGGSSCCRCEVEHYGRLPGNFPESKVRAVTFYLTTSRENSYYTKITKGPTQLKLILGGQESLAESMELSVPEDDPVRHGWVLTFNFYPPVEAGPGMEWKLLDGDSNIYSAVLLHSSDIDQEGLPGTYRVYACQYAAVKKLWYSVRFDLVRAQVIIEKGIPEFNEKSRPFSKDNTPPLFQNRSFGNPQIPHYEHLKDRVDCRHSPCGLSNLFW